jgi:hypothetical protein
MDTSRRILSSHTTYMMKKMAQKSRNALLANTSWAIIDASGNHAQIEKDTAHLIVIDAMRGVLVATLPPSALGLDTFSKH